MAPPDRSDHPRRMDTRADIGSVDLNANAGSRMSENALRLAAWVEWLLHPEEHDYDRTVIYPDGTKREEPRRVTRASQTPGRCEPVDVPFESVVPEYEVLQIPGRYGGLLDATGSNAPRATWQLAPRP